MGEKSPTHRTAAGSHLRFPEYLDGTARLSLILWPIPTLPKRPLALVPVGASWRAPAVLPGLGRMLGLARACGGATGRVVQGIAASMNGTAYHGSIDVEPGIASLPDGG
jgi:hypothetical protein